MLVIQRSKNIWRSAGPSRSQMACRRAGSAQEAKPLANSVKARPSAVACRLAHSWPFAHTLAGVRKVRAQFYEAESELGVGNIEVVDRDAAVLLDEAVV